MSIADLIPSAEEIAARERLLAQTFYLVRQDLLGERARCKKYGACNAKHTYLTLMCIDRPWSGVTEGLYGLWHAAGAGKDLDSLPEESRDKIRRLTQHFGGDLADSHPRTASGIVTTDASVIEYGAELIGTLEPISRQKAQSLLWRINARGLRPPLVVQGLRGGI